MRRLPHLGFLFLLISLLPVTRALYAQQKPFFKQIRLGSPGVIPIELYTSKEGIIWISTSEGLWYLKDEQPRGPIFSNRGTYKADDKPQSKNLIFPWEGGANSSEASKTVFKKLHSILYFSPGNHSFERPGYIGQGSDGTMYFITRDSIFFWKINSDVKSISYPGLNTPLFKTLVDEEDNVYEVGEGIVLTTIELRDSMDSRHRLTKKLKKIHTCGVAGKNYSIYSLARDQKLKSRIWLGANNGLFYFNTDKEMIIPASNLKIKVTITEIYTGDEDKIWFSTLEKGMGVFDLLTKTFNFYPYRFKGNSASPINTFCYKGPNEFFIAALDSLPAVFNTETHNYSFIHDPAFANSPNIISDIKVNPEGKLILIKGGKIYCGNVSNDTMTRAPSLNDSLAIKPFISSLELSNNTPLATLEYQPELLKKIILNHDQNDLIVHYDLNGIHDHANILLEWRVEGYTDEWNQEYPFEGPKILILPHLNPGKYSLQIKLRTYNARWQSLPAKLDVIIKRPYWQSWWLWTFVVLGLVMIIGFIFWWRIKVVKKRERERFAHEKQILELEAMALRAQMNPHFIFNCLNSIKSLIQQHDEEKSVTYLTTFSKLIRNLFNNADKKDISLYDEIETCKLYLQLEAMRFDTKFSYSVNVDENVDLKSIQVPALIIQPFIENAIWHGIVPRNNGGKVSLNVISKNGVIEIFIDDDGIGREASQQNKSASEITHQSKGVNLSQSRLELNNLLQQRQANLEVIDKKDEKGAATGTTVIIKIKEERS